MTQTRTPQKNILLLSNTTNAGMKPLEHAVEEIRGVLGGRRDVLFIPYANPGKVVYEQYYETECYHGAGYVQYKTLLPVFDDLGFVIHLISEQKNLNRSIQRAEAIFVGGGNTYELLRRLKEYGLLYPIREAVNRGVPYIGSSAGSNVAGLTIGNTNDMPAAESYGRDALGLVPFNVNCHYQDAVSLTPEQRAAVLEIAPQLRIMLDHQGETRDERLEEYQALGNLETIIALREGAMLRITGDEVRLKGKTGAKIFRPGEAPAEYAAEPRVDGLLR